MSVHRFILKNLYSSAQGGSRLAKIHIAKAYVEILKESYRLVAILFGTLFCVVLAALGLVLGLTALTLNQVTQVDLNGLVILGGAIFLASLILYFTLNSERTWLRVARVDEILKTLGEADGE